MQMDARACCCRQFCGAMSRNRELHGAFVALRGAICGRPHLMQAVQACCDDREIDAALVEELHEYACQATGHAWSSDALLGALHVMHAEFSGAGSVEVVFTPTEHAWMGSAPDWPARGAVPRTPDWPARGAVPRTPDRGTKRPRQSDWLVSVGGSAGHGFPAGPHAPYAPYVPRGAQGAQGAQGPGIGGAGGTGAPPGPRSPSNDGSILPLLRSLDPPEREYIAGLPAAEARRLCAENARLTVDSGQPLRFQVVASRLPDDVKTDVLQRMDAAARDPHAPKDQKFIQWVRTALRLPIGVTRPVGLDGDPTAVRAMLARMRAGMDRVVSGQVRAKEALLEVVASWAGGSGQGMVIGLHGPPGIGKTSLVKYGIAEVLDLPFGIVSINTSVDAVAGFPPTYEQSRHGQVADVLMRGRCMNPILLLDEADKGATDARGMDMNSLMCSLTDPQAGTFFDRHFPGVPLALDGALIFLTYNDPDRLCRILRDRVTEIRMDGFSTKEQAAIGASHLLPSLLSELNMADVELEPGAIDALVQGYTRCATGGLRPLRKAMRRLLLRVNLIVRTGSADALDLGPKHRGVDEMVAGLETRVRVTADVVGELMGSTTQAREAPSMFS